MANEVRKIVEVQENTWTQASGKIIAGLIVFLVAGSLIYLAQFPFRGNDAALSIARVVCGLIAFGGLALVGSAIYTGVQARTIPGVGCECPYCDKVIRFESEPTQSFDCEFCNRTVHFEAGVPIPVRTINCPFCHTDHRVAINVLRYVCDNCNRPLELAAQVAGARAPAAGQEAATSNFDVLLIAADRRHEIEIAMKLQNILVVNLPEARRLMAAASTTSPLIVSHGVPQRKAEALRRQLQDVGATVTLRPVNESAPPAPPA